ncbi:MULTISPECIES: type I-B CRISPR-associated protein Cas7/Csh2 [unclassified Haloferax]|uniref:type I-B CRISPR-associated protein Cas7/Csh2 n=1 Tax=unclassified Haloferax TaxID=2625095 RepID=UPI002875D78B|nr:MULTISPECIES: type I-B CRISPR-associated protein Cas7/Csh2 [unclassified Haloferax]MDS0241385.1 type I-B CRISPR-associated protein Cas7/Csh2 [Haloferax sp. S2CR25]MDS0444506.1 type I-B CRISPR-associated protein Cas7/Csh2 [Haloferax sp. S2CR25-2]
MTEITDTVANRSEIVFITDAQDCNPNGNPLGENRPRQDPVTGQGVITDVRLKRYLRDQLEADGHGVFVKKTAEGTSGSRAALALDVLGDITTEEELEEIDDIAEQFLANALDVRYFGATLSFNKDAENAVHEALYEQFEGGNYTGPVQFSPARSLNAVELNEESNTLTSVISTNEGKDVGGYGLDDHRIKYGIFPFHAIIDEHGAENTGLTDSDVERLDTLCWRALKNQTVSRSKVGQSPRLYLRVEYAKEGFQDGDLHNAVTLDRESAGNSEPMPDEELRNVNDVCLDVTTLLNRLETLSDAGQVESVAVIGSEYLSVSVDGDVIGTAADLGSELNARGVPTHEVDVYEDFQETLPSE